MKKISIALVCLLTFSIIFAQREMIRKEKNVTVFLDRKTAVKTYEYADGRKLTIDLTGKTPYGIMIEAVEKPLQNEPVSVKLQFSAADSDEIMSDDLRYMFDSLYDTLRAVVGGERYRGEKPLDIVVSLCRFGEYGYCYKKNNIVTVRFIEDKKILKSYTLETHQLKDKKKRVLFVDKIAGDFKKL